jgi:hypothetical protein
LAKNLNYESINTGISLTLSEKIKHFFKTPTEKYPNALTSSQEVGWFKSSDLNTRGRVGKSGCDVTRFADHYYSMIGRSPFAKKDPTKKK